MDRLTRLCTLSERHALAILLVTDRAEHRNLIAALLAEIEESRVCGISAIRLHQVATPAAALGALDAGAFDVVLLDHPAAGTTGEEALQKLVASPGAVPVVALTDLRDEAAGITALNSGAQDYLAHWQLDATLLSRSLIYAIERHRLSREMARRARELEAGEDRLRRLIDGSVDAIVICDRSGLVLFANPAAGTLFGRSRHELAGKPLGHAVDAGVAELTLPTRDGRGVIAEMRVSDLDWQGRPARLAVLRDITAHKETLRQLEETRLRQVTLRDQLLSHVSHELRTPLTAIEQWVTLLRDELLGAVTVEQRRAVDAALRNCRHLEKMISDLLEATRSDTGRLRVEPLRASVANVAEDAIAAVRASLRDDVLDFRLDLEDGLPDMLADPSRIRQVLINLLGNAAKFTPPGGRITLTAGRDPGSPGELRLSVSDTGCGIPPAEQERIFEHFYQIEDGTRAARRGLGLGLYLCRQIVGGHGGRIWVESSVGAGSTFRFTVPAFSIRALLSGLPPPAPRGGPCLIGALARTPADAPLRGYESRLLDEVRRTLSDCLMPDRDLLLPRLAIDDRGECSLLVVDADAAGSARFVERVRGQLARAGTDLRERLAVTFDIVPIDVPTAARSLGESWQDAMVGALDAAVPDLLRRVGMAGVLPS